MSHEGFTNIPSFPQLIRMARQPSNALNNCGSRPDISWKYIEEIEKYEYKCLDKNKLFPRPLTEVLVNKKIKAKEQIKVERGSPIFAKGASFAVGSFEEIFSNNYQNYEFVKNLFRIPRPHLANLKKTYFNSFSLFFFSWLLFLFWSQDP